MAGLLDFFAPPGLPNTAAAIRAVVNPIRRSKDTIQFNSIGGGVLGAGGLLPRPDEE